MIRYRIYSRLAAAFATLATGTVTGLVRTVPLIRHWPSAASAAIRTVWKTPRLGPWLKSTCLVASSIGVVAALPLIPMGGAIAGLVLGQMGAWKRRDYRKEGSFFTFLLNGIKEAWQTVDEADDKLVEELMPKVRSYLPPPLEEGETVYEVDPIRALTSLVSALLGTLVEAPALMLVFICRMPMVDIQFLRTIWFGESWELPLLAEFLIKLLITLVLAILNILVAIAIPPASIVASLGIHVRRGYTEGLRHAWSCIIDDLRKVDDFLGKLGKTRLD